MNPNSTLTRATKMSKSTLALSTRSNSENQNKKRSRDDLDKCEDQTETFDSLLIRIQQMIDDGNRKIEKKIEASNDDIVGVISTLRDEMHQLKADYARDFSRLNESHVRMETDVQKNQDAVNRLQKSKDLLLTGVPYNPSENMDVMMQKVAVALGYDDTDTPLVYTKRLARAPIVAGATPPILLQFAFRASRDDFFHRYFTKRNLNLNHLGYNADRRIYINENLIESDRRIKGIALKLKHCGKIRHVFSKDGIVYVKPSDNVPALPIYFVDQLAEYGWSKHN